MPKYRYICEACGFRFALTAPARDKDEIVTCLRCRTLLGRRVLTASENRKALRGEMLPRKFSGCG